MKIAIDVSPIVYGTGVSIYTRNLVSNLLAVDKKNKYLLLGMSLRKGKEISKFYDSIKGNFEGKVFPLPPTLSEFLWNTLHIFSIEILLGKVDVYHSSDWTQAPSKAFKVTTIHDLTPIKFPKYTPERIVSVHKRRLAWVKKEVDVVIVPSEATRSDAIEIGISKGKIRVIPEAVEDIFRPVGTSGIDKVTKKYGADSGYLLAVGTNPRKNLDMIIKAYDAVKNDYQSLKLIIVGRTKNVGSEKRGVRYAGYVSDQELAALYSGARMLVYPSIYEGFGLPILQAFACACPVVTSNVSSMPEVAGKAAVLVNPKNLESIVEGIREVYKKRSLYSKRGLSRAKKFSWERTAAETLAVYKEASGS